jgi:hypothetical protein
VLTVGIDNEPVVGVFLHERAQPFEPRLIDLDRDLGHGLVYPEFGQIHLG